MCDVDEKLVLKCNYELLERSLVGLYVPELGATIYRLSLYKTSGPRKYMADFRPTIQLENKCFGTINGTYFLSRPCIFKAIQQALEDRSNKPKL